MEQQLDSGDKKPVVDFGLTCSFILMKDTSQSRLNT